MIVLSGVYHIFQTDPHQDFIDYIIYYCNIYSIKSIAEEMNYDALWDAKVAESTVKAIADKFGLPHAYCDPDEVQRAERNIIGKTKLEWLKWFHEWSEDEFINHLKNDYEKRERFWIERLEEIYVDPMLFVCGIDHLDSFENLLKERKYDVKVLEKKWIPNNSTE